MDKNKEECRAKLIARVKRMEGQLRGITKMMEQERNCVDVLKQVAAVSGAMRSLGQVIVEQHLQDCLKDAARDEDNQERLIHEMVDLFGKFSR